MAIFLMDSMEIALDIYGILMDLEGYSMDPCHFTDSQCLMDTDGIYAWMVCAIPFDIDFVGFWMDILKVGLLKVGFENPISSCSMTFGWLDPVEKWEIELHFETCLQRNGISCNSLS